MARILKVLIASFIITVCILAVCFMFGPYIFGLDAVGEYLGGNIVIITVVITALVYPLANSKLQ